MKTWFITGATGGLAIQMVHHLLERGDRVAATIRKPGVLNELQAQYGSRLWQANLDLTNAAQIKEVAERAIGELGTIDVVVNNAAYGLYGAMEEASDDQLEHQFQTNVFGSLRVARAFLPIFGTGASVILSKSPVKPAIMRHPGWGCIVLPNGPLKVLSKHWPKKSRPSA